MLFEIKNIETYYDLIYAPSRRLTLRRGGHHHHDPREQRGG